MGFMDDEEVRFDATGAELEMLVTTRAASRILLTCIFTGISERRKKNQVVT